MAEINPVHNRGYRKTIPADRLRELLDYDPETGLFVWKVRRGSAVAGRGSGSKGYYGYLHIRVDGELHAAHRLAWLHVYGEWPEADIDHINGVRSDNRIVNLRPATAQQNCRNSRKRPNCASEHKGITKIQNAKKQWRVRIWNGAKSVQIGVFASHDEAVQAYRSAALQYHGEFARLK